MSGLKDEDPEAAEPAARRSMPVTDLAEADLRAILAAEPAGPGYGLSDIPDVPDDGSAGRDGGLGPRTA